MLLSLEYLLLRAAYIQGLSNEIKDKLAVRDETDCLELQLCN